MNLYQALNQDYREFKTQEQLKLREAENNKKKSLKESILKPTDTEIEKDDKNIQDAKRKEIEDKIGELKVALQDEAISDDEKKEVEKELADLEAKFNECSGSTKMDEAALTGMTHSTIKTKLNKDELYAKSPALKQWGVSDEDEVQDVLSDPDSKSIICSLNGTTDGVNTYFLASYSQDTYANVVEELKNEVGIEISEPVYDSESSQKDDPSKVIPLKDEEISETCTEIQHLINAQNIIDEIINIVTDEGSIDPDKAKELAIKAKKEIEDHYNECTPGPIKDSDDEQEEIQECEIKSFRILRKAPKSNSYMIEAETTEGMKYITGRNFDEKTKVLDEAEIHDNKEKATESFKGLLK